MLGRALRRVGRVLSSIWLRLLVVNLIVVAVPVIGITFAHLHERQLLAALERDLIDQAAVVRAAVAAAPAADWSRVVADSGAITGARVEVLDASGRVIAPLGPTPVDRSQRPEVRSALAGRYGAATQLDSSRRRLALAIALPRHGGSGAVIGVVRVTRSTAPVMAQLVVLRRRLFQLLLLALAATAALSLFLAATIARPLDALTRSAERIAAGDRGARLALARRDEIGQLSRAVDRMAHELDRRAREQRDLAADISHELKTPLAAIRGAGELLRDGAVAEPEARDRFLAMILADADRLDRLVSRLLELARLEAAEAPAIAADLVELTRAAIARAAAPPGSPTVTLIAPATATVCVRADAVTTAIENVVVNACQHARAGTAVTVTVDVADDSTSRARVRVHNHGAPISPAVQARLGQRFFTTRAGRGGSGLGLAMVRAVVSGHGGTTGVTSDAAAGTTFWLSLPAPGEASPPAPALARAHRAARRST